MGSLELSPLELLSLALVYTHTLQPAEHIVQSARNISEEF